MRLTRLLADLPRTVNITHLNPSIKRPLQVTAQNYSFAVIPITCRNRQPEDQGNGKPLSLYRPLPLAGEIF